MTTWGLAMMSWGEAQWPMWGIVLMCVAVVAVLGLAVWGAYALATSSTRRSRSGRDPDQEGRRPRIMSETGTAEKQDPVLTLRERYARGEIDEVELDRRLDGLLRTEPGHPGGQHAATAQHSAAAEPANGPPAPPSSRAGSVHPASGPGRS
jgi:hypothetical protein